MSPLLVSCVVLLASLLAPPQSATARPMDAVAARGCTMMGTTGPDRLAGTRHSDVLCGLGGADKLRGNGGSDVLRGGGGRDLLQGKKGADLLLAGSGADKAYGGAGADDLRGGRGDDGLGGGLGPDDLSGGPGRDIALYGQRGRSVRVTIGRGANDGVRGEHDNVRGDVEDVRGGRGNDVLTGNGKSNELFGGSGRDRLVGKGGSDVLDGGGGNDRIDARDGAASLGRAAQAGSVDRVVCGAGEDTAFVDPGDVVDPGCEHVFGAPQNHPPTGLTLSNASVAENEPAGTAVGTLSASDPDPGDTASFALVPGAGSTDNGSFQIVGSQLRTAATFDYEAKHTYSVRIRATDHGTPAGQIVKAFTITVTDTAEPPLIDNMSLSTSEDTPKTITLSATDPEGDDVTEFVTSAPSHGTLGAVGPIACSGAPNVCTADVSFTPDANWNGPAGFSYTASDGTHVSPPATVSITVDPVNDTPTAADGGRTTDEDTPLTLDLASLVSDVETSDANLTYEIVDQPPPAEGSATATTFTPAANFNGTTSLTYKVTDRGDPDNCTGGPPACDAPLSSTTQTVSITVNPVNDTPTASDGSRTTDEDVPVALNLSSLVDDQETDNSNLTYSIVSQPAHGIATSTTYTPDGDFNGTDSFEYQVTDRGDPDNCTPGPGCAAPEASAVRTVTITVNPVNDAPIAIDGNRTTDEDTDLPLDLGALVSDVETSDADLTYEIVTPPANGTATTTTYTPDPNFNGTDSLTYKVTDRGDPDNCSAAPCDAPKTSSTQTVSITVNPVNDTPIAADGARTTDEDTPVPLNLDEFASDVETSDANLVYTIVSPPAHGTATATTYTPNADFNGTDSFTYSVTDRGDPDGCGAPGPGCDAPETSAVGTVTITVNDVNDAPINTVPAGPVTAVQDTDTPIAGLSVADVDAGSDDVQLTLSAVHGTLTVSTSVFSGVGALQVVDNGTKTVVVTASLAQINTTLADANGLVYHGDAAYTGPDTLTVSSDDLGHTGSGGPQTDTDTVALSVVPPNQAPVASDQSVTTSEDAAKTVTLSASDADGDPLTFDFGTGTTQGVLGPIGPATCTGATPNVCTANVTYTPDADYNGPDSFTFTANDGTVDSAPGTVSITVTPVNDAPKLQNTEATSLAYTENDPATLITATTTVSDIDSANFDTGTLTVDYSTGGTVDDRLEIINNGQIAVSGSDVTFGGTTIGNFTGGTGTTPLVVTLNANATAAATEALVRAVAFRNVSDAPSSAARTVRFVLTDGDGGTSAPAARNIALTAVNDPPTLAGIEGAAVSYVESVDSPPSQSQVTNTLTIGDPDNANLAGATVTITGGCQTGEDSLVFSNQNGITGSYNAGTCTLTLTGSSSLANYETALRSVKYQNSSDTPNTATRTVTFQVDDGQSANHASNTQARDITVTPSNDSPAASADTFNGANSALAGVTLAVSTSPSTPNVAVSGSVLANDTDPDTAHANLTATAGTTSAQGGAVAVNSDGSFTYTPAPGFTGSDSFTYTVHDNGSPDRTIPATVTINVTGPRVWFVNPGGAAGGNGTSALPLNSLAPLSTGGGSDILDGNGDVIFVYQGTGNATSGGFVLEANQRLVGQPQGLSVTNANGTYNLVTVGGANPTITNATGAGLTLADGNTIQRVDVKNASGVGVTGTAIGTLTYGANTTISGNGGGLALSGAAGGAIDVGADISTSAGRSVSIANRSSGTTSLTGAINDTGTGILLSSNTGATISFTGTLNASTGANDALTATGGGTVNVNTGATRTLNTTTGTALTLNGVGGAISLTDLDKNGAGTGISLTAAGASVTIPSGATIASTTTAGVTIDQGTGAFSYGGTISNSSGRAVQVTNRNTGSPGLVQFAGSIASTGGTGVNLDNNDNGTITFSGGLVLSTGANSAFSATNGGTVNVDNTGVTNTLTTTTGIALNVANTTIGATGLKFQSISANGAASGIVLSGTGSTAGLTVTGTGTADSGGTIQNTTSHAVSLINTDNVDLQWLKISGPDHAGVKGTGVTNFSYRNGTLTGVGDSQTTQDDAAFAFNTLGANNVDGVLTITGNTVTNPYGAGVEVRNAAGTLSNANISSNTFQSTTDPATSKQDGVSLFIEGTTTTAAALTTATINNNTILNFPSGNGVELTGAQITSTTAPRVTFGVPDSTTNRVVVGGNDIRGNATNKMGAFGVAASVTGMADGNVRIANNGTAAVPMQNMLGEGIGVGASGTANADFVVENNFVSPNNILGNVGISANANRRDVGGTIVATPDVNATIQNNTVSNTSGSGIKVLHFNSNGTLRAKVVNNTVGAPAQPNPGIDIENGSSNDPTFNPTLCAQVSANAATGSGPDGFGNTFAGVDVIERSTSDTTYRLQFHGLTPNPATAAQTETFLAGQNPASSLGGGFYAGKRASVSEGSNFEACTITF